MLWDQQQFNMDQRTGSLAFQPFVILYQCFPLQLQNICVYLKSMWKYCPPANPVSLTKPKFHNVPFVLFSPIRLIRSLLLSPPPLLHRILKVLWSLMWPFALCSCIMLMKQLTGHQNYQSGFMDHMAFKYSLSGHHKSPMSNKKIEYFSKREMLWMNVRAWEKLKIHFCS